MTKLKFEGIPVGTRIRAYDFEPMEGRPERYVEGVIIESLMTPERYAAYKIFADSDSCAHVNKHGDEWSRVNEAVYVPHEVTFDYDKRIEILS